MFKFKRLIFLAILAFSLTGAGSAQQITQQAENCTPATGEPIRIGAVFPEGTLISRRIGEAHQGASAMMSVVNACGGVDGRPVEWLYIPANDREEAIQAATTLIEEENVPIIVGSGGIAVREGLEEATEQSGVVFWEVTETLSGSSEWAFTPRPTHYQLGQAAVTFALEHINVPELRVALIYEDRQRGQAIAQGILDTLPDAPIIALSYSENLFNTNRLATQIRDEGVNVVLLGAFTNDADSLWYALRQADANIAAWIHIGGTGYREDLCERFGNNDGLITVTPTGPVNNDYRTQVLNGLYAAYRENYMRENSRPPSETADLSASGTYLLLHHVLPAVQGDYTPQNIRDAILSLDLNKPTGMMGEGIVIQDGINQYPGIVAQQRQEGLFCSSWPASIATCAVPVLPFPTWRERAIADENRICSDAA